MARKQMARTKKILDDNGESFGESIDKFSQAATQFAITQATQNERLNGIDSTVRTLQGELHQLRDYKEQQYEYLNTRIDDMSEKLDVQTATLTTTIENALKGVGTRLETVETWRYLILGGAAVVMFIIAEFGVDLIKKLF